MTRKANCDNPGGSKLKVALDDALEHVQRLRSLLQAQRFPATVEAGTQTDGLVDEAASSCRDPAGSSPQLPASVSHTPNSKAGPLSTAPQHMLSPSARRPPLRALDSSVQHACVGVLSPASRAGPCRPAPCSPAGLHRTAAPHTSSQNPAAQAITSSTPAATPPPGCSRQLHPHPRDKILSPVLEATSNAPGPHAAAQHPHLGTLYASTPPPPPPPPALHAGPTHPHPVTPWRQPSGATPCMRRPHGPSAGPGPGSWPVDLHAAAAAAAAAGAAAAAEPVSAFTPNTTAMRLRAAMQWMQLQLQDPTSRTPRQRRHSDSSVSPALKMLEEGMEQQQLEMEMEVCGSGGTGGGPSGDVGYGGVGVAGTLFVESDAEPASSGEGGHEGRGGEDGIGGGGAAGTRAQCGEARFLEEQQPQQQQQQQQQRRQRAQQEWRAGKRAQEQQAWPRFLLFAEEEEKATQPGMAVLGAAPSSVSLWAPQTYGHRSQQQRQQQQLPCIDENNGPGAGMRRSGAPKKKVGCGGPENNSDRLPAGVKAAEAVESRGPGDRAAARGPFCDMSRAGSQNRGPGLQDWSDPGRATLQGPKPVQQWLGLYNV